MHLARHIRLYLVAQLLIFSLAANAQLQQLPPPPVLTPAGFRLIINGETGGQAVYNKWPHPEWPGGSSGVTWAIGYDATAQSRALILQDWHKLADAPRLADTHALRHAAAKQAAHDLRGVTVPWALSVEVFYNVDLVRVDQLCRKSFPGFDTLRPTAQDALRSLAFNRGICFAGDRYREMRAIRDDVPKKDYADMALQERLMKRLWRGTDIEQGMNNRREAEAKLFEAP